MREARSMGSDHNNNSSFSVYRDALNSSQDNANAVGLVRQQKALPAAMAQQASKILVLSSNSPGKTF